MVNFVTAIRFFLHQLEHGIENEIGDGKDPYCIRLEQSVLPVVHGTKIVMVLSLIERLVIQVEEMPQNNKHAGHQLKNKLINLGFEENWSGWIELEGFLSLRHCFAHEFGKVTKRQEGPLNDFLNKLEDGLILDEEGQAITPFFEIENGEISLKPNATFRLAKLCNPVLNFLLKNGLTIEKSPYENS